MGGFSQPQCGTAVMSFDAFISRWQVSGLAAMHLVLIIFNGLGRTELNRGLSKFNGNIVLDDLF